mmetsp:Transcript_13195/g.55237  ORF Transcript_13195/g.55237 Transcript_13195/m.55237 type:complete len:282 (-) Transcript_13195:1324-2169(-)
MRPSYASTSSSLETRPAAPRASTRAAHLAARCASSSDPGSPDSWSCTLLSATSDAAYAPSDRNPGSVAAIATKSRSPDAPARSALASRSAAGSIAHALTRAETSPPSVAPASPDSSSQCCLRAASAATSGRPRCSAAHVPTAPREPGPAPPSPVPSAPTSEMACTSVASASAGTVAMPATTACAAAASAAAAREAREAASEQSACAMACAAGRAPPGAREPSPSPSSAMQPLVKRSMSTSCVSVSASAALDANFVSACAAQYAATSPAPLSRARRCLAPRA